MPLMRKGQREQEFVQSSWLVDIDLLEITFCIWRIGKEAATDDDLNAQNGTYNSAKEKKDRVQRE
jgi:hypothetical protein